MVDDLDAGMDLEAAAEFLDMTPRALSERCRHGKGPKRFCKRPTRFTRRALIEWQREQQSAIETAGNGDEGDRA